MSCRGRKRKVSSRMKHITEAGEFKSYMFNAFQSTYETQHNLDLELQEQSCGIPGWDTGIHGVLPPIRVPRRQWWFCGGSGEGRYWSRLKIPLETSPHLVSTLGYPYTSLCVVYAKKERSRHQWYQKIKRTSECARREVDVQRKIFWHIYPSCHLVCNQAPYNLCYCYQLETLSGGLHRGIQSSPYRVWYVFAATNCYRYWFKQ